MIDVYVSIPLSQVTWLMCSNKQFTQGVCPVYPRVSGQLIIAMDAELK